MVFFGKAVLMSSTLFVYYGATMDLNQLLTRLYDTVSAE